MAKTAFITDDNIYCYTRMPFGLKNIGANFQEGMNKAFAGFIGKIVEVYVDDIIVKSKQKESAPQDLKHVCLFVCFFFFRNQENYDETQPKKCTFGVLFGKCLGYLGSKRGIEANLTKIKVIQDMP